MRFDDIEMADEENRFARARAVNSRDEIALARIWPEHLHVIAGKSRTAEPRRHRVSGGGRVAHRISRINFDQLLENVVRHLPRGRVRLSGQRVRAER